MQLAKYLSNLSIQNQVINKFRKAQSFTVGFSLRLEISTVGPFHSRAMNSLKLFYSCVSLVPLHRPGHINAPYWSVQVGVNCGGRRWEDEMKGTERGEDVRALAADTRLLVLLVIRWGVGWGFVLQKRREKNSILKLLPELIFSLLWCSSTLWTWATGWITYMDVDMFNLGTYELCYIRTVNRIDLVNRFNLVIMDFNTFNLVACELYYIWTWLDLLYVDFVYRIDLV